MTYEELKAEAEKQGYHLIRMVHGHWIDMGNFEQCSRCKATHLKGFNSLYGKVTWTRTAYCSNCGALMDKVTEWED